jgi:thioredoxin 1
MLKHFTDDNWQAEALEVSKIKPVLVDFFATWCGPCQMQAPILEEVAGVMGDKAIVGKVNTEEAMKTANDFSIMSLPTLLIFKDGKEVKRFVGVQMKDDLVSELKHLA